MQRKYTYNLFMLTLMAAFFFRLWEGHLLDVAKEKRLDAHTTESAVFREQRMEEAMIDYLQESQQRGRDAGIYLLESRFGSEAFPHSYEAEVFSKLSKRWSQNVWFGEYTKMMEGIWEDVVCFPVPVSTQKKDATVLYEDSWMTERTYGGTRGHEGVDLMASRNERGLYPIVSMTDGVVSNLGWLEQGGYRIGITSPSGGYFYYAHLDSYASLSVGDEVKAGQILGFMGDSGYGPEGTVGQFSVHLHLGIYIYPNGREVSVNPYWILRFLEQHRIKCAY